MGNRRRNRILHIIQKEDPTRYRIRTVLPEKGRGRKHRPRKKKVEQV